MVNLWKQLELVDEAEMRPKACVECLAQRSAFWIVVRSLRVQQRGYAMRPRQTPHSREKTFIGVRLHAFEKRIVLRTIQKVLCAFGLFELCDPRGLQSGKLLKRIMAKLGKIRRIDLANGEQWIPFAENSV